MMFAAHEYRQQYDPTFGHALDIRRDTHKVQTVVQNAEKHSADQCAEDGPPAPSNSSSA